VQDDRRLDRVRAVELVGTGQGPGYHMGAVAAEVDTAIAPSTRSVLKRQAPARTPVWRRLGMEDTTRPVGYRLPEQSPLSPRESSLGAANY
jgi:hypothetical protein